MLGDVPCSGRDFVRANGDGASIESALGIASSLKARQADLKLPYYPRPTRCQTKKVAEPSGDQQRGACPDTGAAASARSCGIERPDQECLVRLRSLCRLPGAGAIPRCGASAPGRLVEGVACQRRSFLCQSVDHARYERERRSCGSAANLAGGCELRGCRYGDGRDARCIPEPGSGPRSLRRTLCGHLDRNMGFHHVRAHGKSANRVQGGWRWRCLYAHQR